MTVVTLARFCASSRRTFSQCAIIVLGAFAALLGSAPSATAQPVQIVVTIVQVKALDAIDPLTCCGYQPADFYAEITIAGQIFYSRTRNNDDNYSPSDWIFSKPVVGGEHKITVGIRDEDNPFGQCPVLNWCVLDDVVDVNPANDKRALDLIISNIQGGNCTISGDATGRCGTIIERSGDQPKKAMLRFMIEVR